MKISEKIQSIRDDYKNKLIRVTDDFSVNQGDIINRIYAYLNDEYVACTDENAIFWNESTPRIPHFAKNIDLDTKDLIPYGIGETNFFQGWILKMKFRKWLRENYFAITLDDLCDGVSSFGSHVIKTVDNDGEIKIEECDLRNLFFNPLVKSIRDTDIVEIHTLSENDIKDKDGIWDNIDKLLEVAKKEDKDDTTSDEYEIWEFFGMYNDEYKHIIGAGSGDKVTIAFEETLKKEKCPYWDFHIGKYRGRWLRVGVVERLFKLQERANALINQNAETSKIASLLLLRTNDPQTRGNVLNGLENGDIINSADLQQIALDNRGLTQFIDEMKLIEQQADMLCLTPEVVTGDSLPSNTPFRSMAVLTNAAKSAFKTTRDRIGTVLENLLIEVLLPAVVKKWNKEEIFEIAEDQDDIQLYNEALLNYNKVEFLKQRALVMAEDKDIPALSQEEMNLFSEEMTGLLENQTQRKLTIPKGFFNFKYGIKLNITGEAVDKQQQNDAYFNALQMIQANPMLARNPLFRQYCENNGINPYKITTIEIEKLMQSQQLKAQPQQMGGKKDTLMAQVDTTK